jgi:transcriptional regulator with XRE-family HTH domain
MKKPMQQLRNRRHALRLTLEEVARRAGLSKGFLSLVENGKSRLGLDTAVRLAKALRVSLEELSGMMREDEQ